MPEQVTKTIRETAREHFIEAGYVDQDCDDMVEATLQLMASLTGADVETVADALIVSANTWRGPRVVAVILDEGL